MQLQENWSNGPYFCIKNVTHFSESMQEEVYSTFARKQFTRVSTAAYLHICIYQQFEHNTLKH